MVRQHGEVLLRVSILFKPNEFNSVWLDLKSVSQKRLKREVQARDVWGNVVRHPDIAEAKSKNTYRVWLRIRLNQLHAVWMRVK